MGNINCTIFGHKWEGVIMGFNHERKAIGRCSKCNMPIVSENLIASKSMYKDYKDGFDKNIEKKLGIDE